MKKLIWKQSLQFSSNENWTVVQAWIFSDLIFILIQVVFITARIASIFISSTAVHIWISYIYSHLFTTSQVYLEPTLWPAPSWLVKSVGRVLHWYCRGHGFKFRTGLNFFWLYFHYFLSSVHNCEDRSNICLFMRICGKIKITASTW